MPDSSPFQVVGAQTVSGIPFKVLWTVGDASARGFKSASDDNRPLSQMISTEHSTRYLTGRKRATIINKAIKPITERRSISSLPWQMHLR
jgi:hypothetical protein